MNGSDGSNSNNGGGAPTSPPPQQQRSSRAVRAELEARHRLIVERKRKYGPAAHEQVGRVFGDLTPAWYARLRLLTPAFYADSAEVAVLGLSAMHDRPLSDLEARALAEHATDHLDRQALVSWGFAGIALYMTWRGRRTLRFPMFTPQVIPPPPGAYLRHAMWHGARYVAYSVALNLTVQAPIMAYSATYDRQKVHADPRLSAFWKGNDGDEAGQGHSGLQERSGGDGWSDESAQYKGSYTGADTQQQQSMQEASQEGWETYKQIKQQQQQQQQQQNPPPPQYGKSTQSQNSASWGSSSSSISGWGNSDFDDASPVAASSQNAGPYGNSNGSGGSAWERLRHQSQGASQRQQQQQRTPPPPSASSGGSWGDSGDGVDRAAQEKAQRDFDELLERDRQGQQGQGRSGWGGR